MNKPRKLLRESEEQRARRSKVFHLGLYGFFFLLAVVILWLLRELILPFIVGALLAYICRPVMNAFKYPWLPNELRVALLLGFFVGGVTFLGYKVKSAIPTEEEKLELMVKIKYKFNEKFNSLMEIDPNTKKGNWFYNLMVKDLEPIREKINHLLSFDKDQQGRFLAYVEKEKGLESDKYLEYYKEEQKNETAEGSKASPPTLEADHTKRKALLKSLMHTGSIWVVMPITFLFLLLDKGHIFHYFIRLVPNRYFELSLTTFHEVDRAIGNYLRGTFLECFLVGFSFFIGLILLGVPFNISVTIGVIAGLTNAIPFLGHLIGLAVGLAYALVAEDVHPLIPFLTADSLIWGIIVLVGIVHVLDNVLFQPVVLGGAVNLHPIVVALGVISGSVIFGFAGMLLAVPTIVVFKVTTETLYRELKAYYII